MNDKYLLSAVCPTKTFCGFLTIVSLCFFSTTSVRAGESHPPVPVERLPSLLKELNSESLQQRVTAMEEIGYVRPPIAVREKQEVLCQFVTDSAAEMREMALKTIWRSLEGSDSVESCISPSFTDEDERVLRASSIAIGRLFAMTKKDFPHLLKLVKHPNHEVAYRAGEALSRLGTDQGVEIAIQTFVQMLDKRISLEAEEVYVLSKTYAPAIEIDKLGNRKPERVRKALSTDAVRERVIPALVKTASFRKPLVRVVSIKVMKWMDTPSPQLIESLYMRIKDDAAPAVRIQALEATVALLKRVERGDFTAGVLSVDPKDYLSLMLSRTKSSFEDERFQSARVLGLLKNSSAEVVRALEELLKDQSEKVRVYSLSSLGKIGPNASSAVPAIIAFLEQEGLTLRDTAWAIKALQQIATPRSIAYAEKVIARLEKKERMAAGKKQNK